MFKKSILCLFLSCLIFISSCNITDVKTSDIKPIVKVQKKVPQENIVEYVLDSIVKQCNAEYLKDRKICFLGIETNLTNDKTADDFAKYFINGFNKNVTKLYELEESDAIMHLTLNLSYDGSPIKIKSNSQSGMKYLGLTEVVPDEEKPKSNYGLLNKSETILISASLIIIDNNTEEVLHYDKIVSVSIYNSKGIEKQL